MYLYRATSIFFLAYCFTVIFSFTAHATTVSGIVTDEKNNPLPFANVFVQNTTNGVTTNAQGKYTLELAPGKYDVVFQYLGYTKQTKTITVVDNTLTLNVQLLPQEFNLGEVVIKAGGKDPAYAIIKHAQEKRTFYLNQVNSYSCDVYIKNVWRLDSTAKSFMGIHINSDTGKDALSHSIIYLAESQSQYNFKKPDNVKEIMYSSRVSGNKQAFSWSQASDFKFNFYNYLVYATGLSNRGFVSPISGSAMLYYNYKLLGTFMDGSHKIYKIQVIPKREHDPVFSGTIYIVDKSWRIYSSGLMLTKDANLDYVDTLSVRQTFEPVTDSVWMPVFQHFSFRFKILGLIWGTGNITGIFKNYQIEPVFPPHFFNNEQLKILDGANKKDTLYWNQNRPVPLTIAEKKDYEKKDSLSRIYDTPAYKDSMERKFNKLNFFNLLYGYNYTRSSKNYRLYFSTPFYNTNFNSVEGLNYEQDVSFHKSIGDSESYSINGAVRYGFSDNLLSAKIEGLLADNPLKLATWSAGGGRFVQQVNPDNPIVELFNTYYSLFDGENYMKIYDNSFVYIEHERELINGLKLNANITYSSRVPLVNTTNYNWAKASAPQYTSNEPQYLNGFANITPNTALLLKLTATIHFHQQYVSYPHQKFIIGSKYPVLTITYTEGIPAFGTAANYELLEAALKGNFQFGLLGKSAFSIKAGDFLAQQNMSFIDYAHFLGNQTYFAHDYLEGFQLLPYYQYSTNQQFIEAHYEHHFQGFILNKIPLIRSLKLQEVAGIHLLETPAIRYAELDLGLEHIYKFFRIDWVNSYSSTLHLRNGIMIGATGFFGMN